MMEGRIAEIQNDEKRKGALGEELGERKIIIGDPKSPMWIGSAVEARTFFTSDFWRLVDVWRKFHIGLGLPCAGPWTANQPDIVEIVQSFEEHWRTHFSPETVQRLYIEAIIKRLDRW
jgi:hypothetical protein